MFSLTQVVMIEEETIWDPLPTGWSREALGGPGAGGPDELLLLLVHVPGAP